MISDLTYIFMEEILSLYTDFICLCYNRNMVLQTGITHDIKRP